MLKVILSLLFLFIMLSYVFSSEFITSKTILKDLNLYDKTIQINNPVPIEPKTRTLEEEIITTVKNENNVTTPAAYFPILESVSNAANLE
jgi:hypothetical protein